MTSCHPLRRSPANQVTSGWSKLSFLANISAKTSAHFFPDSNSSRIMLSEVCSLPRVPRCHWRSQYGKTDIPSFPTAPSVVAVQVVSSVFVGILDCCMSSQA